MSGNRTAEIFLTLGQLRQLVEKVGEEDAPAVVAAVICCLEEGGTITSEQATSLRTNFADLHLEAVAPEVVEFYSCLLELVAGGAGSFLGDE
jgi:hypothetical protein